MKKKISGKRIGVYIGIVALLLGITIGAVNVGKRTKRGAKAGNAPELPSVEATVTDAKEVVTTEDVKETTTESASEEAVLEKPSTAIKSEYKEDKKDGKTSESGNANDTKPSTHQTSGNVQPTTNGNTNNNGSNTNNGGVTPAPTSTTTTESAKEDTTPKACEHAWKEVTKRVWVEPVTHTEEVEIVVTPEGYTTEYQLETHAFCRNCGDMGVMTTDSIAHHVLSCQRGNSSYWFDDVEVPVQVWHDAVTKMETKTVVDKEGYYKDEVVSYECTKCGAKKSKQLK